MTNTEATQQVATIRKGAVIVLRPEYQDAGDSFVRIAVADSYGEGGAERVLVVALAGLPINPTEVIPINMIEAV